MTTHAQPQPAHTHNRKGSTVTKGILRQSRHVEIEINESQTWSSHRMGCTPYFAEDEKMATGSSLGAVSAVAVEGVWEEEEGVPEDKASRE